MASFNDRAIIINLPCFCYIACSQINNRIFIVCLLYFQASDGCVVVVEAADIGPSPSGLRVSGQWPDGQCCPGAVPPTVVHLPEPVPQTGCCPHIRPLEPYVAVGMLIF